MTAKGNFTHALQFQRREGHELVTHGVYRRALSLLTAGAWISCRLSSPEQLADACCFSCTKQVPPAPGIRGVAAVGGRHAGAARQPAVPGRLSHHGAMWRTPSAGMHCLTLHSAARGSLVAACWRDALAKAVWHCRPGGSSEYGWMWRSSSCAGSLAPHTLATRSACPPACLSFRDQCVVMASAWSAKVRATSLWRYVAPAQQYGMYIECKTLAFNAVQPFQQQ